MALERSARSGANWRDVWGKLWAALHRLQYRLQLLEGGAVGSSWSPRRNAAAGGGGGGRSQSASNLAQASLSGGAHRDAAAGSPPPAHRGALAGESKSETSLLLADYDGASAQYGGAMGNGKVERHECELVGHEPTYTSHRHTDELLSALPALFDELGQDDIDAPGKAPPARATQPRVLEPGRRPLSAARSRGAGAARPGSAGRPRPAAHGEAKLFYLGAAGTGA